VELRKPSAALSAKIKEWISAGAPASFPAKTVHEHGYLFLHADLALYAYGLTPEGAVVYLDMDRFVHEFDPVNVVFPTGINAVAQAARARPELRELLPERPPSARDCPECKGTGDVNEWGACRCAGLGWIP
jgi:hypothetical protein